jgi:hypothetical protein
MIPPEQFARRVETLWGFSSFGGDIVGPPREWLERTTNLARFTEPGQCGHFAPFEVPALYAQELGDFFVRSCRRRHPLRARRRFPTSRSGIRL